MITQIKNFLTDNKTYLFYLGGTILVFVTTFILLNDSFMIGRDELWYTDYSLRFDDTAIEDDIRHIIDEDIHQIAFLPAYRLVQGTSVSIFGKTLFGLRALQLMGGILLILFVAWLFRLHKRRDYNLLFFVILLVTNYWAAGYLYDARPDWWVGILAVISTGFIIEFIKTKKKWCLHLAVFIASLTTAVYWNGLAVVGGIASVIFYLKMTKFIRWKDLLLSYLIQIFTVLLFLGIQIFIFIQEFIVLIQNNAVDTVRLANGSAFTGFLSSLIHFLHNSFFAEPSRWLFTFFVGTILYLSYILLKKGNLDTLHKHVLYIFIYFQIGYIILVALRGHNVRSEFMILPWWFLWMTIALNYGYEYLLKSGKKRLYQIYYCSLVSVVVFVGVQGIVLLYNGHINSGQWAAYQQYGKNISSVLSDQDGRVLARYDLAWLLPNQSKLFFDSINFQKPTSTQKTSELFKKYQVESILVGERSRLRLDAPYEHNKEWHKYWNEVLNNEFELVDIVYNEYYEHNKGNPPVDSMGFKTEVWVRKR